MKNRMREKDVKKMTISRRRYIKYSVGGIGAALLLESIPSFLPSVKADAQETPSSSTYPPYPEPIDNPSLIVPDSTPELNMADPRHPLHSLYKKIIPPKRRLREEPSPGQGDFGTTLYATPGVLGVYAMQEVRTDLTLPAQPPDRWLYAPTLECPNKASLESVTVYKRAGTDPLTLRVYGVWNHITGGFVVWKPMDSTWLSTYTRMFTEGRLYGTEVIKLNNYWKVLLYNFNTSSWDLQASYFTETSRTDGWDIWESFFNGTCPTTLRNIETNKLQVWQNGTWKYVTKDSGFGTEWLYQWSCGYPKGWTDKYFHWWVIY